MKIIDFTSELQNEFDSFFEQAFASCGFLYDPDGVHEDLRNIQSVFANPGGGFWALFQNDLIAGTAGLKVIDNINMIGELKCMYVLPDLQGKGLGQKLIDKVFLESRNRKLKTIRLDVKVDADRAVRLYRKNGFYEIPRYNDNANDVFFMEKRI